MTLTEEHGINTERHVMWDIAVFALAGALVVFLVITMGVRAQEEAIHNRCQDRLMALSLAQQSYLVANGEYAQELPLLRPFLDEAHQRMPMVCPITGNKFEVLVQQERYIILAPYTPYSVNTGDASW